MPLQGGQWESLTPESLSAPQRYGLAILSVAAALGGTLVLGRYKFTATEFPLFLFAIAITVWYAGPRAATLAVLLSSLSFDYFYTEPAYSFAITRADIPHFTIFVLFGLLLTWFSSVRHHAERELLRSRNELVKEVVERTQQASLLNLTHDTIFVRDADDVITYWNRGAQELYGWTAAEAIGQHAHALLQTVFPVSMDVVRAELLSTGRWEGELRKTRADGTEVVVASRWSLRRDDQALPAAILETNNDITERKRREEEVRALNEELAKRTTQLEATNKELEAFSYSVSHDLRAPLRHMAGFTELLQRHAASHLDEKSQRYVKMILESAKRMGSLIDDLLAFSRIGRSEAHRTTFSLQQIVQEALADVREETGARNIVWRVGALPTCYGDRSMLRLALSNLISNAVKFTRTRPQAEIEIACAEQQPDRIVLRIRDNGVGFDMRYVNKLFGVFQRLHAAESFEGTGIGLATVQRIAHRHGGTAWAESVLDNGATFYFSLSNARGA
ncbi:MAG: sensor histidine kinase [Gemmatimonadetes bacterium]|nr:sensor histidine kinase [Gemmatimonadota bacterium]